jgi:predicted ATPase
VADALLRGCPNLALLATSREPLGIDGERVYRVPSLRVPADGADAGAVRASEAVRKLEDRAAAQGVPLAWDEDNSTRAWCSSATPVPGRAGTGCWKPSGSTRPGGWTPWGRR